MTWDVDLVLMVRVITNDIATPQKYTDAYLQQVIVTSAILADSQIAFPITYQYDISAITISPDPIVKGDLIFQALVPLKSACILNQGNFQTAVGEGIKVRDGDSAIDTSVSFRGYRDILELGPCASYEKLLWEIQSGKSQGRSAGEIGNAVLSPFRAPGTTGVRDISVFFDGFARYFSNSSFGSSRFR